MTSTVTALTRTHSRLLRAFAIGAGSGFVAGAFFVCLIVWQFGNLIGTQSAPYSIGTTDTIERWPERAPVKLDDAVSAVLEQARERPTSTTGHATPKLGSSDTAVIESSPADAGELQNRDLLIPVEGVAADALSRQFSDPRGGVRQHEAIDILAPRNTPVRAVEDGTIARLFLSKAGGITVYQFDPSGKFCYYYAHLERYASGLREGGAVRRGDVVGYVGTSGNAPKGTPHLHFAIFKLTAARRWWEGTPIDPYDVLK
jgi:murein DD-endopeptidase MepM/ murein hydrolase activator NlpD